MLQRQWSLKSLLHFTISRGSSWDAKNPHSATSSCGGMPHRAKSWGEIKNFSFIWNSALFSHQNLLVAFLCSGLRMERTSNLNDRLQNITWHLINNANWHLSLWARLRILTVVSSRSPVSPSNKNDNLRGSDGKEPWLSQLSNQGHPQHWDHWDHKA